VINIQTIVRSRRADESNFAVTARHSNVELDILLLLFLAHIMIFIFIDVILIFFVNFVIFFIFFAVTSGEFKKKKKD
jgi:hypothetical protein